jgi:uncharacterized protein
VEDANHFDWKEIDAYICTAIEPHPNAGAAELSRFLGRQVLLATKGPKPRKVFPTATFPKLDATITFQDEFPLHMCSKESVWAVLGLVRGMIGQKGITEDWKEKDLDWRRWDDLT